MFSFSNSLPGLTEDRPCTGQGGSKLYLQLLPSVSSSCFTIQWERRLCNREVTSLRPSLLHIPSLREGLHCPSFPRRDT